MTDRFGGGRGKDTVSDEEWARILGEAPEDTTVAADGSRQGKVNDLGASKGRTGETKGADTYEVGYGKPPKHTQFQKGRSGNPNGRPTGKSELECLRDMRGLFWSAAKTPVTTTVGGKRTKIPALDAVYLKLFARAIEGHGPSIRFAHTLARETMAEHEEWQVAFYERSQELVEELENQPDNEKNGETIKLLNDVIERINAKPTDKL